MSRGAGVEGGRLKVCHAITMMELGGAQQNTLYTVSHLDASRFDPMLVTGTEGPLVEEARKSGVRCHFLPSLVRPVAPARDAKALLDLARIFRRERPDIVHTHSSKAGILGRAAARLAGVPIAVHSIHGWGFHPGQSRIVHGLYVALERAAAAVTTSFIAVSRANVAQGAALGILEEGRAHLIRSGIPLRDHRPADEGAPPPPPPWPAPGEGGAVAGMVACLKPQKAPEDFVRVAARVLKEDPRARFVLIGDGELRGRIEELAGRLGVSGSFHLLGWRRDVAELMRSLDLLVHTSRWEGLPRVIPEAMATGLPVVATRVDGAPEAVEEGVTGHLFEPGDVEGMARAVLDLSRDPDKRRRMGRAGRERCGEWDIDAMVRAQERLYESLAGEVASRGYNRPRREAAEIRDSRDDAGT